MLKERISLESIQLLGLPELTKKPKLKGQLSRNRDHRSLLNNFGTNEAHIQRQLGRKVDEDVSSVQEGMLIKQELAPKTYSGDRITPVPQFVIDEIILEREKYELRKGKVIDFQDHGYIWCKENGNPFNRGSYKKPFKRLLAECGFPDMHWHDLRHTYATILSENNLSLKAIASAMGHSKEIFTADTYTNPQQIITSLSPILCKPPK